MPITHKLPVEREIVLSHRKQQKDSLAQVQKRKVRLTSKKGYNRSTDHT